MRRWSMSSLTFGSLFSGIGGIDLGLDRAGFICEWQVENDPFCTKVLQKHWPNVTRYGDIRTIDVSTLARVDLIAGGMPCTPHSLAGKRNASADERDLWPEFYRIVRELKPRWVLVENVLGLLSSEDNRFYGGILRDLAACRYDAQWFVLSAAQFGAPHLRERVFVVAHSPGARWKVRDLAAGIHDGSDTSSPLAHTQSDTEGWYPVGDETPFTRFACSGENVANPNGHRCRQWADQQERFSECEGTPDSCNDGEKEYVAHSCSTGWQECQSSTIASNTGHTAGRTSAPEPTGMAQSGVCGDASRIPTRMDRHRWPAGPDQPQHSWEPPRVTQEKIPNRSARLKALGNAVLPQIAEHIGRAILESEVSHA
jgi:DNA-cytosine methyltransferase